MTDWVESIVQRFGEVGVGLLILLENVIPPIPSEVILPLAGYFAERGMLHPVLAWFAATVGSVLGAYILYAVASWLGWERLERLSRKKWFIFATESDLRRGEKVFERYGWWCIGFGRCIPFIRSAVSLPAGLGRMNLFGFGAVTFLGSGIWNAIFIWLGMRVGENFEVIQTYVSPVSKVVVVLLVAGLVYLVVRRIKRRGASDDQSADVPEHV